MAARQKLNQAYATGTFFIAGLVGLIANSGLVFIITLIVLLVLNVASGEIRPDRTRRR